MRSIYIMILLTGVLYACNPEIPTVLTLGYTIDKVVCQANSNYFVADGVSQLGLEVKLYTLAGTYTDINGQTRSRYKEIPHGKWRHHDIRFYDRSGREYPADYSTTTVTADHIDFYAEVDGIRSSKPVLQLLAEYPEEGEAITAEEEPVFFRMNVRAADPVPSLKRYPIVFHILENEKFRNGLQELDADVVYRTVDILNNVFGRKDSHASNGANPNIEFVPAVRNPDGRLLDEPGINRIYYTQAEETAFEQGDIFKPATYWDYDKYLNVWIFNIRSFAFYNESYMFQRVPPMYYRAGDYDADALPMPAFLTINEMTDEQLAQWKKSPTLTTESTTVSWQAVGLFFLKSGMTSQDTRFAFQMASFLGVLPNYGLSETTHHYGTPKIWIDDYCDDTFRFNSYYYATNKGGQAEVDYGNTNTKYTATLNSDGISGVPGPPWVIYTSYNVAEQNSFNSVITQDQARRIEWVLNNAVARQAWKDTYAID